MEATGRISRKKVKAEKKMSGHKEKRENKQAEIEIVGGELQTTIRNTVLEGVSENTVIDKEIVASGDIMDSSYTLTGSSKTQLEGVSEKPEIDDEIMVSGDIVDSSNILTGIKDTQLEGVYEKPVTDKNMMASGDLVDSSKTSTTTSSVCEKSTDKLSECKDKFKCESSREIEESIFDTVVPSAPPCYSSFEGNVVERIRSLDESSLSSLFPLRSHCVPLPPNAVIHNHPLYVLLCDYLRSCTHLEHSLKKHESLVAEAERHQEMVWSVTEELVVKSGKCKDEVPVSATYCKTSALKDELHLSQLGCCLSAARETLHVECALHLFDSEVCHLRVEHFVQAEEEAHSVIPSRDELCICVLVLFSFVQRHELNPKFLSKTHQWLLRLGQALLKVAAPSDRLLLLSQLLRSPKGVGIWGAPLVKFNMPPPRITALQPAIESCLELELIVEALSIILDSLTLQEFGNYTRKVINIEEAWVVLDSTGEEEIPNVPDDEDLEIFLERIPLKAAVIHVLGLSGDECPHSVSGVDVLRCFALSNTLLKILGKGLLRSEMRRYPCFRKKLILLIHHLIHIVTDFWEFSFSFNFERDHAMQARVAVEYDALFIRTVAYLFKCDSYSDGWEMLAKLPFKSLSLHARWHLLALLHNSKKVDWFKDVLVPSEGLQGWIAEIKETSSSFDAVIIAASEQEASFLLTAITNMAVTSGDRNFAEAVAYDIFRVSHLNSDITMKEFSNVSGNHLASIFSNHPCLFPVLIDWLKEVFQEREKGIVALFSELPLQLWEPSEDDISTLSSWILKHDPQSLKSTVARLILLGMPWRDICRGKALPLGVTYSAAALALEVCLAWDAKGRITQLASSAMWMESSISTWAWSLVGALALHPYDRIMASSQPSFSSISEDALHAVINHGLQETNPLASLVAVLATNLGHSWNQAEKHSFSHLSIVVAHGKYIEAISALYLILPLFVDHLNDLICSKNFEKLLMSVVFADRTYMKMAKNLISSNFPGPILIHLGNMIISHLEQSFRFSTTCSWFVSLWLNCILLIPNWIHEKEALFLADLVIRSAVLEDSDKGWQEAIFLLKKVKEQLPSPSETSRGTFSSLFNLLAREPLPGSPHPQSLVVRNSWPTFPWFVLVALDVDEECERMLWEGIQMELKAAPSSTCTISINSLLKDACKKSDLQPFPVSCLCIYRWARQALDTSLGHPILPLMWARFFSLYNKLFSSQNGSLNLLFEGSSSRAAILVEIKKKLAESAEWYSKEAAEACQESSHWLRHCARLFRAFGLWLEGDYDSYTSSSLPQQYEPEWLKKVLLHSSKKIWEKEYVDFAQAKKDILCAVQSWNSFRGHSEEAVGNRDSIQDPESSLPLQRILKRLQSCSDVSPLAFPPISASVSSNHVQIVCGNEMSSKAIRSCLFPLMECARLFSLYNSEHTALDCTLLELLPCLYQDVNVEFTRLVRCGQPVSGESSKTCIKCISPARIIFKVKESQICEDVRSALETNIIDRGKVVSNVLLQAPQEACAAGVLLENMIRELVLGKKNSTQSLKVKETSITLLNYLLDALNDDAMSHYLPAKKLLSSCIEILGQAFVLGEEQQLLPLISRMIENPHLVGFLAPLLSPTAMASSVLFQAYGTLVRHLTNMDNNVAFVLLSKFEINNWVKQDTLITDRLELVQLVIDGLASFSTNGNEPMLVSGLLQSHLRTLLVYNFPEIFKEVIELLLKAVGDHCLQPLIFYDLLDAIISLGNIRPGSKAHLLLPNTEISSESLTPLLKQFAAEQRVLSQQQVYDLITFLADFFHRERLHFGLHGLYPKYRLHVKGFQIFLELLGLTLISASNHMEVAVFTSSSSTTALEYLWPALRKTFAPWLFPYWEDQLKEEGALWILELMDGHPPLTPWVPSDSQYAHMMALSFSRCIQFLMDVFPGCHNLLNPVWEMYSSLFAHAGVGHHILDIMHESLLMLPWNQFWPSVQNVKDMVHVVESSPPECCAFVFAITLHICWKDWTDSVAPSALLSAQALDSFLKLILLLSSNSAIGKGDRLLSLLIAAKAFSWHNLNPSDYADSLNVFITNVNPLVVLRWNSEEVDGREDLAILQLLRSIAGLCEPTWQQGLPPRCLPYFQFIARLLCTVIGGAHCKVPPGSCSTDVTLLYLLQEMEGAVMKGFPHVGCEEQATEMTSVVKKVLLPLLSMASSKFIEALSVALAPKPSQPSCNQPTILFAKGLLRALHGSGLHHVHLYLLVESALETALIDKQSACLLYDDVPKLLHVQGDSKVVVADTLSSAGHVLALSAFLHSLPLLFCDSHTAPGQSDYSNTLYLLIHRWLPAISVVEKVEAKIPLLWAHALILSVEQQGAFEGDSSAADALLMLASSLFSQGNGQEGMVTTLLGAIGLKKNLSPSKRFKVMCLTLAAFLFACIGKEDQQITRMKEALTNVEKMCKRHKELAEIATLATSAAWKTELTLKDGTELIEKLLGRLYPEKSCYLQCVFKGR